MTISKLKFSLFLVIAFLIITQLSINAENHQKNKNKNALQKSQTQVPFTFLDINKILTVFRNNGISDLDKYQANSGLVYPKGTRKTAAFTTGFLFGAKIAGDTIPRVSGSAYASGLQPGIILPDGTPDDPTLDKYRIYRVRPDVYPGGPIVDLSEDAELEEVDEGSIRLQYEKDWTEWPASLGAPFNDVDSNGIYDPAIDIPGVPGADQTAWFVANDQNPELTTNFLGTQPMGIEVQGTYWAYNQLNPIGNMFFRKYKIINKGFQHYTLDSMYLSLWSDVDLGGAGDDFIGTDTTLSMVYCYNSRPNDVVYNPLPPPVTAFTYLQGPLVEGIAGEDRNKNGIDDASDFGIFNGEKVGPGLINLPMTASYYFAGGDPNLGDPPQGRIDGSIYFYNYFQGKIGGTGQFYENPLTGELSPFPLSGDPLKNEGWLDGIFLPPGDRRLGFASGPFTMAPGETQEFIASEIVAGAKPEINYLAAVDVARLYQKYAKSLYDRFFETPIPLPVPELNVVELNKQIILDWGENPQRVNHIENFNKSGYKFEGYNVYQLPSANSDISEAIRLKTFDVVNNVKFIIEDQVDPKSGLVLPAVQQFGDDSGIERFIEITKDTLNRNWPLINGHKYYFAVTAYYYSADTITFPNNIETPLDIITVIPHTKNPGEVFGAEFGDTITVAHDKIDENLLLSDGDVVVTVVDPTKLTGKTYKLTFDKINDTLTVWNLDRIEDNGNTVRVLENQTDQDGELPSPIIDGMQVNVFSAPQDFKGFDITQNGNGIIENEDAARSYERTQIGTDGKGISADWYRDVLQSPSGGALGVNTQMQAGGGYFFCVANPIITTHSTAMKEWTNNGDYWSRILLNNYEIRWTGDHNNPAGKAWMAFTTGSLVDVPFSLWYLGPNLNDPSDDVRMLPWIKDDNWNDIFDFKLDHQTSGGNNDPYTDWIYFEMPGENPAPGEEAYNNLVAQIAVDPPNWDGSVEVEHIARFVIMNWNQHQGNGGIDEWPDPGTVFRIRSTIPNGENDVFSFTAPAPGFSKSLAESQVNEINVWPNPYYGYNSEELNKYERFVTFSHLPQRAKIRIFNLGGVMVKTINKNSPEQFIRWDLTTEHGYLVGSGLYIAYIEMPDIGTTKILKIAIIQSVQIPDRF